MTSARTKRVMILLITVLSLLIGWRVVVYGSSKTADIKTITYVTRPGDTLWNIAVKYDSNANTQEIVSEIEQMNHLSDNDYLQIGQTLQIPVGR